MTSTPTWQATLQQRGILQQAIAAGAKPHTHFNRPGISYPAVKGQINNRWKAIGGNAKGRKYAWLPSKPEGCDFYIPEGEQALKNAIGAAGGGVWIANGEPGVWTYQAAGIQNVLSAGFGEGTTPAHLADKLIAFGVKRVLYPVDKDDTGKRAAKNWRNALKCSGIEFRPLWWGNMVPDKGDANDLWIAIKFDRDAFNRQLCSLEALILPQEEAQPQTRSASNGHGSVSRREAIEQVMRALGILDTGFKDNGWSRKNYHCPFHGEDKNESAGFNRKTGTHNCFACGKKTLAELCQIFNIDWQPYEQTTRRPTVENEGNSEFVPPSDLDPFAHLPSIPPEQRHISSPSPLPSTAIADTPPDATTDGIFHQFLTLLLQFDPDGALPYVFIMRAIQAGQLDYQMPFTHADLLLARKKLDETPQKAPSYDTVQRWFDADSRALATIAEFVPPVLGDSLGGTNSESCYRLRSKPAILEVLMHRAKVAALAACYPTDETIVPFNTALLKAVGCEQPEQIADAIEQTQSIIDQKLAVEQSRAAYDLRHYLARVRDYATCRDVIPFPAEMPLCTTGDLRAALARALKNAGLMPKPTKRDWMWELGIHTPKGVDSVLERVGIEQHEDIKGVTLNPEKPIGQQIRHYGKTHRAKVLHVEVRDAKGVPVSQHFYHSDQQIHAAVCDHAVSGGSVWAVFQLPNETILRELPPPKPRAARSKHDVSEQQSEPAQPQTVDPETDTHREQPPGVYPGEVDPVWFREHQINLLRALRWVKYDAGQKHYQNPTTGRRAPENASIAELLALLSGRDVAEIIGENMPPEFTARLREKSVYRHPVTPPDLWAVSRELAELVF